MFETLSGRLESTFKGLRGKGRLSPEDIDATCREIRIALLEADVALPVVKEFVAAVKERALVVAASKVLNPAQQIIKIVNEELVGILGGSNRGLTLAKSGPTIIMLCGLQGAGKTTLAGKLGLWLKDKGHHPMLVACDLQRPNAVTQLKVVGERAGVEVYAPHPGATVDTDEVVGDPVGVAQAGIEEARRRGHDVVIVDTAGRLGVDTLLMRQAADIKDALQPQEVLFVLDAMIGQDAVATAQAFAQGVDFTGVVLTKLDGDARGGAALSVAGVCHRPILFASNGEKLTDVDLFHPERMASRILGMGDVLTLIETAEKHFDQAEAEAMADKVLGGGDFTMQDFLDQMLQVRKMGSMASILGMLPGMGQLKEQINNVDEGEIDRVMAIIRSMTPKEREDPKIINGSRRLRISKGSGTTVTEINQLVDRFFEARKMMKQLTSGGGMPGMPPIPGMKRAINKQQGKKKKKGPTPRKAQPIKTDAALPTGISADLAKQLTQGLPATWKQ